MSADDEAAFAIWLDAGRVVKDENMRVCPPEDAANLAWEGCKSLCAEYRRLSNAPHHTGVADLLGVFATDALQQPDVVGFRIVAREDLIDLVRRHGTPQLVNLVESCTLGERSDGGRFGNIAITYAGAKARLPPPADWPPMCDLGPWRVFTFGPEAVSS